MKLSHLMLLLLFFFTSVSADYPQSKYNSHFNDFANIIDRNTEHDMEKQLRELRINDDIEIYIVTVENFKKYSTGDFTLEQFTNNLYNNWDIAYKPLHMGVLLVISKDDKQVFIQIDQDNAPYYNKDMQRIVDSTLSTLFMSENYTENIMRAVNEIISISKVPVPFYIHYKWYLLVCLVIVISMIISEKYHYNESSPIFLVLICKLGSFFIPSSTKKKRDRYGVYQLYDIDETSSGDDGGDRGGDSGDIGSSGY